METTVLKDLLCDTVPHWIGRLEKYLPPKTEKPTEGVIITPETIKRDAAILISPPPGRVSPASSTRRIIGGPDTPQENHAHKAKAAAAAAHASKHLTAPHGTSRLDAKPEHNKSRFSSITGPVVYYDGESQQMLCDLWTAMNSKRGGLRKEMMALKRRQQAQAMAMLAAESEDEKNSESDENSDGGRAEMLRLRLKVERERIKRMNRRAGMPMTMAPMQYKRTRMGPSGSNAPTAPSAATKDDGEASKKLLEAIDDNFDKACKVTETAAFIWLKGDVCENHLTFIVERLRDTAEKIEKSGLVDKPADQGKATVADGSMNPPPVPKSRPELAKRKSDATMRDADVPLLVVPPGPGPIACESDSSSEESRAPSMDSMSPESQPRKHDLTMVDPSPVLAS